MPNWVKTNLKFVGSEEDIQNIKNLVITKDEEKDYEFDFSKIVPYPTREECPKEFLIDESKNEKTDYGYLNPEAYMRVDEEHPYLNWYNWQREMWGTEWNSSDPCWYGNEVWFDTAWSFCKPVVVELSKKFPNVRIDFQFADEDMGDNCDYGWCQNGYITFANLQGQAALKLAMDIWDDEDLYEFKNGEWVYKED